MSTRTKEYILTDSGNHISRRGLNLVNTQGIVLGGKTIIASHVTIRGDLQSSHESSRRSTDGSAVVIGRYCHLDSYCEIIPPHRTLSSSTTLNGDAKQENLEDGTVGVSPRVTYYPIKMGDYVRIGAHSRVSAASISSFVSIGSHCTIGNMCIIKEGCIIHDDTIVPPFTVLAPLSSVRGKPGLVVAELPEVTIDVLRDQLRENYARTIDPKNMK